MAIPAVDEGKLHQAIGQMLNDLGAQQVSQWCEWAMLWVSTRLCTRRAA